MIIKEMLRSGDWLTAERIGVYSLISMAITLLTFAYLVLTATGLSDAQNRPLGTDFSNVYTAGTYALESRAANAYDAALQHGREQQIFGADTPFYGWHYPPVSLLLAAPLALLPYLASLAVWLGLTLLFYVAAIRKILPVPGAWLPTLGFTAIWVNATHGNNAFLSAGLFGLGLALLPARPWLAGLVLGCLCYKPHLALLIPFALLAAGAWCSVFAAAISAAMLVGASLLFFGLEPWYAFFASANFTQTIVLETGGTGFYKMQSIFAWARYIGASLPLAYALHISLAVVVFYRVIRLWRSTAAYDYKAAALITGALLITPYSLDYDLMLMAPAIAFLVRAGLQHGFSPYERTLLFVTWLTPILARPVAEASMIFPGFLSLAALLLLSLRARQEYGRLPA